jgi:uncharacterized membrane protein
MSYANPVLSLRSFEKLRDLPPESRAALAEVLREIGQVAEDTAQDSWRARKAPMAAYWRAVGVYARHVARAVAP